MVQDSRVHAPKMVVEVPQELWDEILTALENTVHYRESGPFFCSLMLARIRLHFDGPDAN